MICGITFYPGTCDPEDILLNRHTWEKGIFYCGDVQCKGKYPTLASMIPGPLTHRRKKES